MSHEIGKNIARLRKHCAMTQEELAAQLGLSFQAVSRWETGATMPDVELLVFRKFFFQIVSFPPNHSVNSIVFPFYLPLFLLSLLGAQLCPSFCTIKPQKTPSCSALF